MATVRAIVGRYIYGSRQYVILRSRLADEPAADRVGDIVFRRATASDLDRLTELDPYGCGSIQRAYVTEDHHWLFVAYHGDRIVATRRYSDPVPPHGLMSRVVQLREGQVWAADVFCLPEYRNRGIGRRLGLFAERSLASSGYREFLGTIVVTNTASLRMTLHDSEPVCYVSYFRLLLYERLRVSKEFPTERRPG